MFATTCAVMVSCNWWDKPDNLSNSAQKTWKSMSFPSAQAQSSAALAEGKTFSKENMVKQDCSGPQIAPQHLTWAGWCRAQSIHTRLEILLVLGPGLIAVHSLLLHLKCPWSSTCLPVNFPEKVMSFLLGHHRWEFQLLLCPTNTALTLPLGW